MENYFSKEDIYLDVKEDNFEKVLKKISLTLEEKGYINSSFYDAVLEREETFPTGLEFANYNIAIPHTDPKHVKTDKIILIKPANFVKFKDMATGSKDLNVKVILLLLVSKPENQIKVLSNIIKQFSCEDFYNNILNSNNTEEIYKTIINKN